MESPVSFPRRIVYETNSTGEVVRRTMVAGNWKMHGDRHSIARLLQALIPNVSDAKTAVAVFPPSVYLDSVANIIRGSDILLGAQNVSSHEQGAYTGEVAADQLCDVGCQMVLVGHSERRTLHHEDDVCVAMKFAQAKRYGLTPVLCVGETQAQREQGLTETVIFQQLTAILSLEAGIAGFENAIIAYEPIWAIGTGLTATGEQAQAVHKAIRRFLQQHDGAIAEAITLLYGGSVKASNARALFAMPDIDGALVGGASLDAAEFTEIVQCIKSSY